MSHFYDSEVIPVGVPPQFTLECDDDHFGSNTVMSRLTVLIFGKMVKVAGHSTWIGRHLGEGDVPQLVEIGSGEEHYVTR